MIRNTFRSKTRLDVARDTAEDAVEGLRNALEAVREQTEKVLDDLPETERGRRPVIAGAILAGGAGAVALGVRKLLGANERDDVPAPDVTPTAPAGPADPALNDPALKAKVESELFQEDSAAAAAKGSISIDVADGVVTLRGEIEDRQTIESIVESATVIDGVRRVESLLHPPGEQPAGVGSG